MRFFRYLTTLIACAAFLVVSPTSAISTVSPSPLLPQSPLAITAYSVTQVGLPQYVEIYNDGDIPLKLREWSLVFDWSAKTTTALATPRLVVGLSADDSHYIAPGGYVLVGFGATVPGAHVQVSSPTINTDNFLSKMHLDHAQYRSYERTFTATTTQVPMRLNQGASGYTTAYAVETRTELWQTPLYIPLSATPLRIVEVLPNPAACQPFDTMLTCNDYVKVYNTSASTLDLAGLRLRTGSVEQNATSSNTVLLGGTLAPSAYGVFPLSLTNSGNWVWLEDAYGVVQYQDSMVAYGDASAKKGQAWSQDTNGLWRWTQYPSPYDMPNQFTDGQPVNSCSSLRLSEIGANLSVQFIELYNASSESVNLRGCQLQTNRSTEISHVFGEQIVAPGAFVSVNVADTKLSLTKTTTGTVYVLSSDGQTEVDARSYENLSENTSYALVDGVWQQTFVTTPGAVNVYEPYVPCQAGYERNLDTGRCNKIAVPSTLTPCDIDEYRSPDTGRCRKLTSATASSLTPCKEGQYRSPETNRCRSLATASTDLKPCAVGQERNLDTNRCRKVTQGDGDAGFSVVETPATSDQVLSWLALAGVGVVSFGYAGWEWRREIWSGLSGLLGMLPFVK
ncbi:hypothetical protein GII36_04935 [Candidatus Mycosynbacter amalyticus]|uniref:LTD domain-containing protein n=1 Tax=Candidatus Mycosynbacter amalyticus TaxID=2665156 RepID=A0A857MKT1_9BACT|nr:lamin tail domain-containing protein [Candidatus Mycosynbacter amalyticus]QHN43166.1 hypothetical protein GII36_04935 [Candidatus Mycosynbacter amalyticus]